MRLTHLLLISCVLLVSTLVVAQEDVTSAVSGIPSSIIGGSLFHRKNNINIEKEIEVEAKDIIVNVGKVKIDIEAEKRRHQENGVEEEEEADAEDGAESVPKSGVNINKEIEIEAKDIIVNIGKVKIDIEKNKRQHSVKPIAIGKPATTPIWKAGKKSGSVLVDTTTPVEVEVPSAQDEVPSAEDTSADSPEFEDFTPSAEPDADETVLGENATAITVQGGEEFARDGVLILTGPQIFSVTFKIVREKVITMKGSDLNVEGEGLGLDDRNRKRREAVTFIIRGRGFVPGGSLFNEISDVVDGTSRGGLFEFLEPRVFLGAIPLKVVRFTDTVILARFLDFEDQRRFEPGTLLARVKVLHVELRREKEKKNKFPGEEIGILGMEEKQRAEIVSVGGLVLPALGAIGGSITSGPVLGVVDGIGIDGRNNNKKEEEKGFETSLLRLFSGLRFDTAVLAVQFSEKDAQKIRGSFNTLFTDGNEFPLDI